MKPFDLQAALNGAAEGRQMVAVPQADVASREDAGITGDKDMTQNTQGG